jgi:hypothetical protein
MLRISRGDEPLTRHEIIAGPADTANSDTEPALWHMLCEDRRRPQGDRCSSRASYWPQGAGCCSHRGGLCYLLPVGLYCSGAFTLQKFSKEAEEAEGGMYAMAAHTTCQTNAVQFAPIWTAVIVVGLGLFTVGLVWSLVVGGRSALAKRNRSETAGAIATERPGGTRSTPIWPLLLGLAIIGVGIFLWYTVGVGPHCDGAFTHQTSAAGADIASAMNGRLSNYSDECRAAAGQQSVIYWGIIGFGGAVFVLGLVLQTLLGHRQSIGHNCR